MRYKWYIAVQLPEEKVIFDHWNWIDCDIPVELD